MRKRLVRVAIFIAVATGVAVGGVSAAGAAGLDASITTGVHWE